MVTCDSAISTLNTSFHSHFFLSSLQNQDVFFLTAFFIYHQFWY